MDTIRLIASDLDATLLDGQSQLPPDFAETVRALAERGIRFAAASGRPIYTLEEMFAPLQDDIILVGDNGGAICWKGESLYLSEMDVADWHTLAGQARSAGHAAVLCGLETAYVEEQFRPYDRVFKRFYTKVEYVPHLEDVTARVDKFTIYFPEGDAQKGYDALYGPVWGGRFSVAVAGADWVDIMNPGVHKGAALLRLGKRLGVLPEGMMAFGDTFNDAEMLKAAGKTVHLGGNIGRPLLCDTPDIAPTDLVVLELSSFQLMTMERSPHIAVVTNLSPNHLDVHKSYEEYIAAKENIFTHQTDQDIAIFNADNEATVRCAEKAPGRVRWFSRQKEVADGVFLRGTSIVCRDAKGERVVMDTSDIKLPGVHNIENYMAAIAV